MYLVKSVYCHAKITPKTFFILQQVLEQNKKSSWLLTINLHHEPNIFSTTGLISKKDYRRITMLEIVTMPWQRIIQQTAVTSCNEQSKIWGFHVSYVCFLHAEGQPVIGILSNWSLKIQNEMPPPLWVWIGLNCFFSLWDITEVDFKGKKTEKWLAIPSNWTPKIQNGMPLPFEYELGWTAFLASGTPQKWISRGKDWKMTFKVSLLTFSM